MDNVLTLIDLYDETDLGLLTRDRSLASTTFLGRYTFIDFVLSNLNNSGIDEIGILVKDHLNSLHKHLGNSNAYLKNPKTGFLSLFINEYGIINPVFNTDINNIKSNDYFLYDSNTKYVLITNCNFIMKMDYSKIIDEHIKSGQRASIVYTEVKDGSEFPNAVKIIGDSLNCVQKFYHSSSKTKCNVCLDTLVIDRQLFMDMLNKSSNLSIILKVTDLVEYIAKYVAKMNLIKYEGFVKHFDSFKNYYKYSMQILKDVDTLKTLLTDPNWLYYTTTHDSRPVIYGTNADVSDSLIANGSTINGTVKNSILARGVLVEEGATVEDSIIFTHCVIKAGTHLKHVVADKRVNFISGKEIKGTEEEPLFFPRGVNV